MRVKIGVLKEHAKDEKRVIFIPDDIKKISKDYELFVEMGLGEGIGFSDDDYIKSGAKICTKSEVWKESKILFKYKSPTKEDYCFFDNNKTLCSLMHPEGDIELIDNLLLSKMNSFSFEYFKSESGIFPLAYVGGQIAGKMAVYYANHFLQSNYGGLGKSLFKVDNTPAPHVMVIGYGNVGGSATRALLDMGCKVTIIGRDKYKMQKNQVFLNGEIDFLEATEGNIAYILPKVDAVIGAILISTFDTKPIITKDMMQLMKKGSVIIDVTCGYGAGYLPDLVQKTTLKAPINTTDSGQIYCKIDNLPSAYPLTSSIAYSNQIINVLPKIIDYIIFNKNIVLVKNGEITKDGKIVHSGVASHILKVREENI